MAHWPCSPFYSCSGRREQLTQFFALCCCSGRPEASVVQAEVPAWFCPEMQDLLSQAQGCLSSHLHEWSDVLNKFIFYLFFSFWWNKYRQSPVCPDSCLGTSLSVQAGADQALWWSRCPCVASSPWGWVFSLALHAQSRDCNNCSVLKHLHWVLCSPLG